VPSPLTGIGQLHITVSDLETVYYAVDDIEGAYAEVTGRGAPSMARPHLVHRDGGTELWMAFVGDPDGTPVGLMVERPAG
jgi:predicted enzyme related to lactoylglutathione lyase